MKKSSFRLSDHKSYSKSTKSSFYVKLKGEKIGKKYRFVFFLSFEEARNIDRCKISYDHRVVQFVIVLFHSILLWLFYFPNYINFYRLRLF